MYGSSFIIATDNPRLFSNRPMDATAIPLPTEDATPPVTNKNFGMTVPPTAPGPADISGSTSPIRMLCRFLQRATSTRVPATSYVPLAFVFALAFVLWRLFSPLGSLKPEHLRELQFRPACAPSVYSRDIPPKRRG